MEDLLSKGSLIVRDVRPSDEHYILATWSKGILRECPFRWMSSHVWKKYHGLMEDLLRRAGVVVAANPEDEDHIVGYGIFTFHDVLPVLHWAYVKDKFRGRGIGRAIVREAIPNFGNQPFAYTHSCLTLQRRAHKWQGHYDPFFMWT
jgi:ribosomal protein S18 acetylase RimI-like enzyme